MSFIGRNKSSSSSSNNINKPRWRPPFLSSSQNDGISTRMHHRNVTTSTTTGNTNTASNTATTTTTTRSGQVVPLPNHLPTTTIATTTGTSTSTTSSRSKVRDVNTSMKVDELQHDRKDKINTNDVELQMLIQTRIVHMVQKDIMPILVGRNNNNNQYHQNHNHNIVERFVRRSFYDSICRVGSSSNSNSNSDVSIATASDMKVDVSMESYHLSYYYYTQCCCSRNRHRHHRGVTTTKYNNNNNNNNNNNCGDEDEEKNDDDDRCSSSCNKNNNYLDDEYDYTDFEVYLMNIIYKEYYYTRALLQQQQMENEELLQQQRISSNRRMHRHHHHLRRGDTRIGSGFNCMNNHSHYEDSRSVIEAQNENEQQPSIVVSSYIDVVVPSPTSFLNIIRTQQEQYEDNIVNVGISKSNVYNTTLLQQSMNVWDPFNMDDDPLHPYYDPYHLIVYPNDNISNSNNNTGNLHSMTNNATVMETQVGDTVRDETSNLQPRSSFISIESIVNETVTKLLIEFDHHDASSIANTNENRPREPLTRSRIKALFRIRRNRNKQQQHLNGTTGSASAAVATAADVAFDETVIGEDNYPQSVIGTATAGLISTTPIHEVARMGHVKLLEYMLHSTTTNIDLRNGFGRTILHCITGGIVPGLEPENNMSIYDRSSDTAKYLVTNKTNNDKRHRIPIDVDSGIIDGDNAAVEDGKEQQPEQYPIHNYDEYYKAMSRKNETISNENNNNAADDTTNRSRLGLNIFTSTRRLLAQRKESSSNVHESKNNDFKNTFDTLSTKRRAPKLGPEYDSSIVSFSIDRMESLQIVMLWKSQPQKVKDNNEESLSEESNNYGNNANDTLFFHSMYEGVSINAVDTIYNRTALHYAAELGRADICDAMISSSQYGCVVMLSIVDSFRRTPCDVAALHGHTSLASYLEARSLLYVDPYGTEEELLSNISIAERHNNDVAYFRQLLAPFCCFETIPLSMVEGHREALLTTTMKMMHESISDFQKAQEKITMKDFLAETANPINKNVNVSTCKTAVVRTTNESGGERSSLRHEAVAINNETAASVNENEAEAATLNEVLFETVVHYPIDPPADITFDDHGVVKSNENIDLDNSSSGDSNLNDNTSDNNSNIDDINNGSNRASDDVKNIINGTETTESNVDIIDWGTFERSLHMGHLEKFLEYHKWIVMDAMFEFKKDPVNAFKAADVPLPIMKSDSPLLRFSDDKLEQRSYTCLICCDEFGAGSDQWKKLSGCSHSFCKDCLVDYISEKAKSSSTGYVIACPHHDCNTLLSPVEMQDLLPVESDAYNRLRRSSNNNFVVTSENFAYCPYPGCGEKHAVHVLHPKNSQLSSCAVLRYIGAVCTNVHNSGSDLPVTADYDYSNETTILTYESVPDPRHYDLFDMVEPKLAHRFCFVCGDKRIHFPMSCTRLEEWKTVVVEQVGKQNIKNDANVTVDFNDIAQQLWLKANTRTCPKCNVSIQKDDGCNHMTCLNASCNHQFCWICRADWSTHNAATGGNYRCNRWVEQKDHEAYDEHANLDDETRARVLAENQMDPNEMGDIYGTARHETRVSRNRSYENARFLHHYERWCAHANSASLEQKMRLTVCERLTPIVQKAVEYDGGVRIFDGKGLSFVHSAFTELLECRSFLQHSYGAAYLLYKSKYQGGMHTLLKRQLYEKKLFEQYQSELELLTEQISDVIARNHIRASEAQIIYLTKLAAAKRKDYTNFMLDILNEEENEMIRSRHKPKTVSAAAAENAIRQALATYEEQDGDRVVIDRNDTVLEDWSCGMCTFRNRGGVTRCEMCSTRR